MWLEYVGFCWSPLPFISMKIEYHGCGFLPFVLLQYGNSVTITELKEWMENWSTIWCMHCCLPFLLHHFHSDDWGKMMLWFVLLLELDQILNCKVLIRNKLINTTCMRFINMKIMRFLIITFIITLCSVICCNNSSLLFHSSSYTNLAAGTFCFVIFVSFRPKTLRNLLLKNWFLMLF